MWKIRKKHKLVFMWKNYVYVLLSHFGRTGSLNMNFWMNSSSLIRLLFLLPAQKSFESCNVAFLQFMSSQIVKKPTKNNEVRISQQRTNMTQTWLFRLYAHKFCIYTLFILNNYQSKSTTYNECIIGFNLTNVWTVTAKARLKSVPWKCLYASQLSLTKVQCVRRH